MDPEEDFQKDKMLEGDRKNYFFSHAEDLMHWNGQPCLHQLLAPAVDVLRTRSLMFKCPTTDILSRSARLTMSKVRINKHLGNFNRSCVHRGQLTKFSLASLILTTRCNTLLCSVHSDCYAFLITSITYLHCMFAQHFKSLKH